MCTPNLSHATPNKHTEIKWGYLTYPPPTIAIAVRKYMKRLRASKPRHLAFQYKYRRWVPIFIGSTHCTQGGQSQKQKIPNNLLKIPFNPQKKNGKSPKIPLIWTRYISCLFSGFKTKVFKFFFTIYMICIWCLCTVGKY